MEKNISYPQAWVQKTSHIRGPGYGKNLISAGLDMDKNLHVLQCGVLASIWGVCASMSGACFYLGCIVLLAIG
jgi:hypothetical protein